MIKRLAIAVLVVVAVGVSMQSSEASPYPIEPHCTLTSLQPDHLGDQVAGTGRVQCNHYDAHLKIHVAVYRSAYRDWDKAWQFGPSVLGECWNCIVKGRTKYVAASYGCWAYWTWSYAYSAGGVPHYLENHSQDYLWACE